MATVEEVFGIADVLFVKPENLTTDVNDFLAQVKYAAHDRGIEDITVPSDGLDLSRDLIFDEAAQNLNLDWDIQDKTLLLSPKGLRVNWDEARTVSSRD